MLAARRLPPPAAGPSWGIPAGSEVPKGAARSPIQPLQPPIANSAGGGVRRLYFPEVVA